MRSVVCRCRRSGDTSCRSKGRGQHESLHPCAASWSCQREMGRCSVIVLLARSQARVGVQPSQPVWVQGTEASVRLGDQEAVGQAHADVARRRPHVAPIEQAAAEAADLQTHGGFVEQPCPHAANTRKALRKTSEVPKLPDLSVTCRPSGLMRQPQNRSRNQPPCPTSTP